MKRIFTLLFCVASIASFAQGNRTTGAFIPGNIVVYRVGDGTGTLRNVSTRVFLDEYNPLTGVLVQSIPMPTAVSGANGPLTAQGTATSEGMLARSADSAYLTFGGYSVDTGITAIGSSTSAIAKRTVGRVDAAGNINTSTILSSTFSGGAIRSVVSTNGTQLWLVGANSGVRFANLGDTATKRVNDATLNNIRTINIYGGQLYVSSSSGSIRVASVGAGIPQDSSNGVFQLSGISPTGSPYQFFMADIDPTVPGMDVLYVADDASQASGGGIKKYSQNSVTHAWDSTGLLFVGQGVRGLTGAVVGTTVGLFATTPTKLVRLVDVGGYNGPISGTADSIAGAGTNMAFRGVALAPIAAISPLSLVSFKGTLTSEGTMLNWKTTNEQNVNSFSIERSVDGKKYASIGNVAAINRPEASYSFNDAVPANGANFYRLKMVDNDGKFKYSNVVIISNRKGVKAYVFPNPATDKITVSHGKASGSSYIRIMNAEGQQVKQLTVQPGALQTPISVSELAKGNYIVVFVNEQETSITRFVK